MPVVTGRWIDLEDGVQVWFDEGGTFRPGTYWLIPTASPPAMWNGPDNLSAKTENRCYGSRTESSATTPSVSETVGKDIITVDHELRREFRDLCVVTSKLAFT